MISYGILCLEAIAVKLVDPYGKEDIDLPVDELCRRASSDVIKTACTVNWGVSLAHRDEVDTLPNIIGKIKGRIVVIKHTLPNLI